MADQKRWFKVWTSLLVDMDHLTAEQIGHWVRLGCRIALVGNNGSVKFEAGWTHINKFFGVNNAEQMLCALPGIECQNRHDGIIVTMNNWYKYQVDSTAAARQKASRSKRRGEEIRGDEIRREDKEDVSNAGASDQCPSVKEFTESWNALFKGQLPSIELPLSRDRERKLKLRLAEHPSTVYWEEVFGAIDSSDFLLGKTASKNGHAGWRCTFDFLIANGTNCVKIHEGQYAKKVTA